MGTNMNIAMLRGILTSDARVTDLADGRTVHNLEVRAGDTVVPVAWYDAIRPPALRAGHEVVVTGRVRRRWFRTGGGSQSRTEVVADAVVRAGSARADRLLGSALAAASRTASSKR